MATLAGAHSERIGLVRELLSAKGRRDQGRYCFEGPTLLAEAQRSAIEIHELFVTESVYHHNDDVRQRDASGTPVFLVDDRTMKKISDLETPPGLVCTASVKYTPLDVILVSPLSLVLADLNDPGNAGTLLRSAEAFGATGVVFGDLGVDPYHPKVVRAAMGAIFRLNLAVAKPQQLAHAAAAASATVLGLDVAGQPLKATGPGDRVALVVGHERRGLGPWEDAITQHVSLPMRGPTESLNAAIAGSIALYELSLTR